MNETTPKVEPRPLGILTPETHITALRYSPCGSILAGASFDQRVRRWDLRTLPEEPAEVDPKAKKPKVTEYPATRMADVTTGHNGFVSTLEFHPSRLLAVSADTWGAIHAWPYFAPQPEPIWSLPQAHDGWVRDLAISPDGDWFVSCGRDQQVRAFSTIDGRQLQEFPHHSEDIFAVAAHPDGKRIASADLHGRILLQALATGEILREFDATDFHTLHRLQDLAGIRRLKFSPDGQTLALIGCIPAGGGNFRGQAQVRLIDVETGKTLHDVPLGETSKNAIAHDAEMLPDNTLLAITTGQSGQGSLFIQHPREDKPRYELNRGTVNNHSLALSPNGKQFAIAATNTGSNGNGKRLNKEGNYAGNYSPIHVFAFA